MAPGLVDALPVRNGNGTVKNNSGEAVPSAYPQPLKLTGALEKFKYEDATPVIGREYDLNIVDDLMNAPNADELLRELAITSELPKKPNCSNYLS